MDRGSLQSAQKTFPDPRIRCCRYVQRLCPLEPMERTSTALSLSYRTYGRLCPVLRGSWSLCLACLTVPHDAFGGFAAALSDRAIIVFAEARLSTDHECVMAYELTRHRFLDLLRTYQPSPYEAFGHGDARFAVPMHHAMKCRDRLHVALKSGLRRLPSEKQTIVDLGPFPGSLLRLLRRMDYTNSARLFGAGLMVSDEFVYFMQRNVQADIHAVNLDPEGGQFQGKGYSENVPLPDDSVQLVFALEIIEHLTSPFHLLAEAYRLLRSGGHVVLTTPNVTRIGNVFKLLIGRTPNDRLAPPGYNNPDDEWRPHAREYAMHELAEMLCQTGFDIAEARFFLGEDTQECRQSVTQHGINWVKWPFYIVPHLRGSLLIVGRKP